MLNSDKTTVYNVGARKRNFSSSEFHTCHLFATRTRIKLFNVKERKLQHLITSASLTKFRHIQSQYYFGKVLVLLGADEKEHATPILTLCHGFLQTDLFLVYLFFCESKAVLVQ